MHQDSEVLPSYRVVRTLGKGAHASVFEALDANLRSVVLKVVELEPGNQAATLARLEREVRVLKGLQHPNIAHLNGAVHEANRFIFEFEYIKGQNLRSWMQSHPVADLLEKRIWILSEIAHGLGAAHARGIIHRDVKPENILIGEKGEVRITDFGLATVEWQTSHLTQEGSSVGTLAYMSPESMNGHDVTTAGDLFSFGFLAYELLTGQYPFPHTNAQSLMRSLLTEIPPSAHLINSRVPLVISRLLDQCVQRNVTDRPPSIWMIQDVFMNYLKSTGLLEYFPDLVWDVPDAVRVKKAYAKKLESLSAALDLKLGNKKFDAVGTLAGLNEFVALFPQSVKAAEYLSAYQRRVRTTFRPRRSLVPAVILGILLLAPRMPRSIVEKTEVLSAAPVSVAPGGRLAVPALPVSSPVAGAAALDSSGAGALVISKSAPARGTRQRSAGGHLKFLVDDDVRVFIDGRRYASDQLLDLPLGAGPHKVLLERDGFRPISRELIVRAGKTSMINVKGSEGERD